MVALGGGELLGQPVDRRGRGGDDLLDARGHRGLEHVEGAVDQHVHRQPRLFGALRDADGGLMEHDVDALHHLVDQPPVADVALDDRHAPLAASRLEVLPPAADEVVEHDDFRGGFGHQVGDVRADQAGAAGDENSLVRHSATLPLDRV